jgi:hypothetical protein
MTEDERKIKAHDDENRRREQEAKSACEDPDADMIDAHVMRGAHDDDDPYQ